MVKAIIINIQEIFLIFRPYYGIIFTNGTLCVPCIVDAKVLLHKTFLWMIITIIKTAEAVFAAKSGMQAPKGLADMV